MIVFVDLVGFGIVIPVLLLHAEESFGATDLQATGLLTAFSIGMVIAGPILGRLSDAYGRRPVLIISQIGTFIGFIVLGFANSLLLLYLGRIIDGISGGNITTARAYINDITTECLQPECTFLRRRVLLSGFHSRNVLHPAREPRSRSAPTPRWSLKR
jgi:DHA1 family tetracycline resistance protein-like MFS transporter